MSLLSLSYFFHLVATVVWLGGLFVMTILVFPETKRILNEHPTLYAYLSRLRKRFFPLINFSMVVLILTGFVQMAGDENYDGVLQFSNEWSRVLLFKHIAFIGMIIGSVLLQFVAAPALERATLLITHGKGSAEETERLRRREVHLTWVNAGLGLLILAFTAWLTAL